MSTKNKVEYERVPGGLIRNTRMNFESNSVQRHFISEEQLRKEAASNNLMASLLKQFYPESNQGEQNEIEDVVVDLDSDDEDSIEPVTSKGRKLKRK